jgi:restriction endonuclease S subunit
LTKAFIENNNGKIPVYGGKQDEIPIGYITDNLKEVKYFEDCLGWNREGSVGYVFYHKHKFTTNDHHRPLLVKNEFKNVINLDYIRIILQKLLFQQGFKWSKTASKEKIQKLAISIPFDEKGNIDIEVQKEIVEKYNYIDELEMKIENYKKQIEELNIDVEENGNYKTEKIGNLFKIEKGKSTYTNKFIVKNRGPFPLYSSQTTNGGVIGSINIFDYDCEAITWTTDGIHAGTVFLRNGKFSMTTHCGVLILKSNIRNVLLDYVYSYLKNNLKQFAVGEQNKRVTTTIIKPIVIPIPINSKGEFDLPTQKVFAGKYRKIEQIKQNISEELDKILNIDVSFG